MSKELKPCPFCGETLQVNNANLGVHSHGSECLMRQQVVVADDPAQVSAWNRRQQAPAEQELIRFDFTNADGRPDSKMISHDEMRERYASIYAAPQPECVITDNSKVIATLEAENERLRMQLAACGVVALSNTPETAAAQRQMHPDYMSASCQDVMRAVDREMELRERVAELEQFASEIIKQYPNPNLDHEDFRVHACRHAETVMAKHREASQLTDDELLNSFTPGNGNKARRRAEALGVSLPVGIDSEGGSHD